MDPSYILVGVLSATSLGVLVWIEIRSRRTGAVRSEENAAPASAETLAAPKRRSRAPQRGG
jgi:hypothetical protein